MTGVNLNDYGVQAHQQPAWARFLEFGLTLPALFYTLIRRRLRHPGGGNDLGRVADLSCIRT